MLVANGLHQHHRASKARRGVAAVVGLWLVLGIALGMRHEAQIAHFRDPHTGELKHAREMVRAHSGDRSDYHQVDSDSDNETCAIATAIHRSVQLTSAPSFVLSQLVEHSSTVVGAISPTISADVYRLAPKTSPPTRV